MGKEAKGRPIEENPSKLRKIDQPPGRPIAFVDSAINGSDGNDSATQAPSQAEHHQSGGKNCPFPDSEALAADRTVQDVMVTDTERHLFVTETDTE